MVEKRMNVMGCSACAVILLMASLLFVASSPLSKGNPWVDTNAMMEIGRSWTLGKIPYRDVFEQRGPVLFLIYAIANLISKSGYVGLWMIETLNIIFAWYATKRFLLFFGNRNQNLINIFAMIVPLMMISSVAFQFGGSPDEFSAPWFILGFLKTFEIIKAGDRRKVKFNALLLGVCAIVVFWIKYTLVIPFICMAIALLVVLLFKKEIHRLFSVIVYGIGGVVVTTVPIFIYFAITGALSDFFNVYFVVNMTTYGKSDISNGLYAVFHRAASIWLIEHPVVTAVVVSNVVTSVWTKKHIFENIVLLTAAFIANLFNVLTGRAYEYTFLTCIIPVSLSLALNMQDCFKTTTNKVKVFGVVLTLGFFVFPIIGNPFVRVMPYIWTNASIASQNHGQYITSKNGLNTMKIMYSNWINSGVERYINADAPFKYFEKTNISNTRYPIQGASIAKSLEKSEPDYVIYRLGDHLSKDDLKDFEKIHNLLEENDLRNYKVANVSHYLYPMRGNFLQWHNNVERTILLEKIK